MPKIENMTLEEKVDELLKYQRSIHHMTVAKTIFSFLTFFVIVILPIVGVIYIGNYLADSLGLSLQEIGETLNRVRSLTDFDSYDIKGFLN